MVARGWGWDRVPPRCEAGEQDAGDHKGPPIRIPATLAPTDTDGLVLGLIRIGRRKRPYGYEGASDATSPNTYP